MKQTKIEQLYNALQVYKHDAKLSKNLHRINDYKAIKKLYEGIKYFSDHEQHSCGAIINILNLSN
jgi:hypothetical protein